jgi:small subunit ribosomal protein S20
MPVIKQAIKKVRQDKKKTIENALRKSAYKKAVAAFRKSPSVDGLKKVYVALDKAAKTNVIHKNKASRLKSRLSKMLKPKTEAKSTPKAESKEK